MNVSLYNEMIKFYNEKSYTHRYIFGFEYHGNIYACHADSSILPFVLTLDKASRSSGYALRFKPNNKIKELLLTSSFVVCSNEYFENLNSKLKYNRGEIFEMLVTNRYGLEWVKDNVPFTEAGDIEVDGIAYQIKFTKATFINEAQMNRLK